MIHSIINPNSCAYGQNFNNHGIENLLAYRQALADEAVSQKVSAIERVRARVALLVSYIPDAPVPEEGLAAFRERIVRLLSGLEDTGNHGIRLVDVHRRLRELEDWIYIPLRRASADQFCRLRSEKPDMTGDALLKTLVGNEIDEYQAGNPEASLNTALVALMRSSPRADILINMIRQRNDKYQATVFNWRPLALPLQGV